jgi:hypothetical protein
MRERRNTNAKTFQHEVAADPAQAVRYMLTASCTLELQLYAS